MPVGYYQKFDNLTSFFTNPVSTPSPFLHRSPQDLLVMSASNEVIRFSDVDNDSRGGRRRRKSNPLMDFIHAIMSPISTSVQKMMSG